MLCSTHTWGKDLKFSTVHRIEFEIDKCDRVRKGFPTQVTLPTTQPLKSIPHAAAGVKFLKY